MALIAMKSGQTPYHMWYGKKPNLRHTQVIGCVSYMHTSDGEHRKLDKKTQKLKLQKQGITAHKIWLIFEVHLTVF